VLRNDEVALTIDMKIDAWLELHQWQSGTQQSRCRVVTLKQGEAVEVISD